MEFCISSNYTTIKQGPNNKITTKYTCSNNPGLTSFNSVNITGVATTAKQQQGRQKCIKYNLQEYHSNPADHSCSI